jgi:hypothetical protein
MLLYKYTEILHKTLDTSLCSAYYSTCFSSSHSTVQTFNNYRHYIKIYTNINMLKITVYSILYMLSYSFNIPKIYVFCFNSYR